MIRLAGIFFALVAVPFTSVNGQVRWAADFNFGLPVNIPAPLAISRTGHPDLKLWAVWAAEPFLRPYNWMWRIGRWSDGRAWEFETIHHKMVLTNRPDPVQWLSITHGFNTVTANRAIEKGRIIVRAGAGCVLAHPESTIDGKTFDEDSGLFGTGYYITGPVVMLAAARPVRFGGIFSLNLEVKVTGGYASVPVVDGRARLMHLALHLNAGPAFSFRVRHKGSAIRPS